MKIREASSYKKCNVLQGEEMHAMQLISDLMKNSLLNGLKLHNKFSPLIKN